MNAKIYRYSGTCDHETLSSFSVSVTNEWDEDMEQPREGLVYISPSSFGKRRCLDDRARPVHRVSHHFGAWLGYGPLTKGFVWASVTGTCLAAVANRFGGYDLTLTERRPAPANEDDGSPERGSCYRRVLEGSGVRFTPNDRRPTREEELEAAQEELSGY
jgi:hypothetical protein